MVGSGKLALVVSSSRDRPDLALASALMSAGSLFIVVVDGDKLGETALCLLLLCVVVSRCCVPGSGGPTGEAASSKLVRHLPLRASLPHPRTKWSEGGRNVVRRW